jgi:uncharacterized protein YbjT (DUF2867 family)
MVKKILVFGATGKQGCSVLCSLSTVARENDWKLYGCCRHTKSGCSGKLQECGVELIEADLNNEDSLRTVLKGIDIVFLLTDSWDQSQSGDNEYRLGSRVARLCKDSGVSQIIFSSLPNVEKVSGGKYKVPQFTNKARIEDDIRGMGFKYTAFVEPAHYLTNWFSFLKKVENDGTITFNIPTRKPFSNVDVTKLVGPTVLYCIQNPDKVNNRNIWIQNGMITADDFAKAATKVLGKNFKVNYLSHEEFKRCDMKGAKDLGEMYGYIDEYGYFGPKEVVSKGLMATDFLDSKLVLNVEQWLEREKDNIRGLIHS